jgi:type I restriction enzyme, S subunit
LVIAYYQMNNWKTYKVKELVDLGILERPMDGNHGEIHPKGSDFTESGVPFIMATDIKNSKLDLLGCKFISKEQSNRLRKGFSYCKDVLLTHKASIGRTAIVPHLESEYIMLTPQVTYYRVKDETQLDYKYLKFYFDSHGFQEIIKSYADIGSTRSYIGITEQLNLPIVLPPIENQHRIASILSSLDDKIELNLQMNKTLEAIAQAIFKEWFVDFRFPSFDGELVDGLPKGWMIKKISEVCEVTDFVANGSFASLAENVKYQTEPDYAILIRLTDYNRGFNGDFIYINESAYKFLKKSKLTGDEIIIANVGANAGDVFRVPQLDRPMTLGPNAIMIKDNCFSNYLYLFCISDMGQHLIKGIISGSAQPKFNKTDFRKIGIIVPNEVIIRRFNEIYSSVYNKILFNHDQNRCLTKIRDNLLSRLMTGKIRVA